MAHSVATTHLRDRVAKRHGRALYEVPVGFKFIGELINADQIILGGEESAGLTIKGHFPEEDGILPASWACLLLTEMVAARGASLGEMIAEVFRKDGALYCERVGIKLTPAVKERLAQRLAADPPTEIGGRRVTASIA